MGKTRIEWVKNPDGSQGSTLNPITGCLNGCNYCYARKLANGRLKARYLAGFDLAPIGDAARKRYEHLVDAFNDPFYPRFWPEKLGDIYRPKLSKAKPRGVFVCDMSDLFGIGVPEEWTRRVMDAIRSNTVDRFFLLTKQPQNLTRFSPYPNNSYIGVSVTNVQQALAAVGPMAEIEASVKFVSYEPLLEEVPCKHIMNLVRWAIIGAQTPVKASTAPKVEWVRSIVEAADRVGVKVFLKNNLLDLVNYESPETDFAFDKKTGEYRQEVPSESERAERPGEAK